MIEYGHHRQCHRGVLMILHRRVIFPWHLQMFQLRNKLVDNPHLINKIIVRFQKLKLIIFKP
jgi:hypothetical protein